MERPSGPLLALLLAVGVSACADGEPPTSASWSGEIRDSAGVTIVENPAVGTGWDEGFRIRELWVVGGPDDIGGPELGFVVDATIDADTVLILDALQQRVSVHGPDGAFVRAVGGPGEGPGELSRFASSVLLVGDTVMVGDWGRGRMHRFLRDGTFLDASLLGTEGGRSWWRKGGDGRLYARTLSRYVDESSGWRGDDVLLRPPPVGSAPDDALGADTVFRFRYVETDVGGPGRPVLPLQVNAPAWAVLPDGRLAWTALGRKELRIQAADGSLERIVRFPGWTRRPPTAAEQAALVELMGDKLVALGGSRETVDRLVPVQPEELPAITAVRAAPDSTIWVQRMGRAGDVHPWSLNAPDPPTGWGGGTWDVLDREGRRLGSVELDARARVLRITDDRVLGVRWDELGREEIVVWELSGGR